MGELDFDKSTQAKYWMFDEESLRECREEASKSVGGDGSNTNKNGTPRVRKTASGYHHIRTTKGPQNGKGISVQTLPPPASPLTPEDQELLVHFHAHQIQRLIGPNAVFPALRRSSSVLSTAIMLFRRFYLSNSVIDFHPRDIAAASALLACKADCERRLPIDVLSHATWIIQMKTAHHAPQLHLCQEELRAVSIPEIEAAERALLQGCDYRLRCHHPYGAIKVLASDISNYLMADCCYPAWEEGLEGEGGINGSPKSVAYGYHPAESPQILATLCERALSVAQSALVYSDVNFLFPPGQIAFAAIAVAVDGYGYGAKLGGGMRDYLAMRFRNKSIQELSDFEEQVGKIVSIWENCSSIDLNRFAPDWQLGRDETWEDTQALELRRVFQVASHLRMPKTTKQLNREYSLAPAPPVSPLQQQDMMGYYHPHPYAGHHYYYHHPQSHYQYPYHPEQQHQQQQKCHHPSSYFVPIHENGGATATAGGRNKRRREDGDVDYRRQHVHRRNHSASIAQQKYPPSSHYPYYNSVSNKVARVTPVMMDH